MIHALHCGSYLLPFDDTTPVDTTQAPASYFMGKPYIMGHTAEFVAQHLGLSREEMDEVALRSHNNAERATKDGSFAEEIVPVQVPRRKKDPVIFDKDEHFRPAMTLEKRIMVTLIHAMKKQGNTLGLATLCGGGGVAMACALEML
jgi:acetyl-CoA C-acetyltransferase